MCHASRLLILTICLGVLAPAGLTQEPKSKSKASQKDDPTIAAVVESIVTRMMAFDKNKDGKLTREEMTDPRLLRLFDRADSNKEGVVTREQLVEMAKQLVAEQGQGGGRGGPGDGPGAPGGFGPGGGGKGGPGKGGKGGFGGPPQPGQILSPFLQKELKLTSAQKSQLDALQSEVDAKLGKILTDEQKTQLKEMRKRGLGGPGGGPGGPGGPRPSGPPPEPPEQLSNPAPELPGLFVRRFD